MERWRELQSKSAVQMSDAELAEFTETSMRGAYNASDLNRVTSAVNEISEKLRAAGGIPYTFDNPVTSRYKIIQLNNLVANATFELNLNGWEWTALEGWKGYVIERRITTDSDVGDAAASMYCNRRPSVSSSGGGTFRTSFSDTGTAGDVYLISMFYRCKPNTGGMVQLGTRQNPDSADIGRTGALLTDGGAGRTAFVTTAANPVFELVITLHSTDTLRTGPMAVIDSVVVCNLTAVCSAAGINNIPTQDWFDDGRCSVCWEKGTPYLLYQEYSSAQSRTVWVGGMSPDIPDAAHMMRYIENIKQLRSTLELDRSLIVDSMKNLTYDGANKIEKVLALAYDYLDSADVGNIYCGQTNLYSGGVFTN